MKAKSRKPPQRPIRRDPGEVALSPIQQCERRFNQLWRAYLALLDGVAKLTAAQLANSHKLDQLLQRSKPHDPFAGLNFLDERLDPDWRDDEEYEGPDAV
jgi:hypothetical protein